MYASKTHSVSSAIFSRLYVLCALLFLCCFAFSCSSPEDTDTNSDSDADSDTDTDSDTDSDTETDDGYIFYEDFDDYEVGDLITEVGGSHWTLWFDGSIDATITDEQFLSAPNSMEIANQADVVFLFDYTQGSFDIEFDILVNEKNMGYYNFQHNWNDGPCTCNCWGPDVYLYSGGIGNLVVSGEIIPFEFEDNQWIHCSHQIDPEVNVAKFVVNNQLVLEWQISAFPDNADHDQYDGFEFYGMADDPGTHYFIDNVSIIPI